MAAENDIVLIYLEEKPLVFARVEEILPDAKPNWYHVRLLMLQVPLQAVTWILRDVYINGETFTMDGKRIRLERVESPRSGPPDPKGDPSSEKRPKKSSGRKVVSLRDFKKD